MMDSDTSDIEEIKVEVEGNEEKEVEVEDNAENPKVRKRKQKKGVADHDGLSESEKLVKRIILSLWPSYVLGLGTNNLRSKNRDTLRYLLRTLLKEHNWVEASGVLSVYMQATSKDKNPPSNRFKYSALLELLKHADKDNDRINPTKVRNLVDIWTKKNGSMKGWPVESKYIVDLEFILFCLMQGNLEDAHQAALCLKQVNEVGNDTVSNMVVGLTFYELWYSSIPKELQWRDSDLVDSPENSHMLATRLSKLGLSGWHNSVESCMGGTQDQCDSDTSVMNDKQIYDDNDQDKQASMEVDAAHQGQKLHQSFQPQGFYLNSDEHTGNGDPLSDTRGYPQDVSSLFALEGLDSWLLPLRLSDQNSFEEFINMHKQLLNDYYNKAVEHLQLSLDLAPATSAALLPLVQLLLIGGRVDEALDRVEKHCCDSAAAFPVRLRAALLEHFDSKNSLLLSHCFEDTLKKDPTCCDSLVKLIKMQQNGDYSLESLVDMIALHLDATYAEHSTWREFASCFFKLSQLEEDCMSTCLDQTENSHMQHHSSFSSHTPKIFAEGKSGKAWKLRCRWWLTRHFSNAKLESEIETGDLQLLAYKAACASHMYGQEFHYVVKARSHLEENDRNLLSFLDLQRQTSIGLYKKLQQKG